MWRAAVPIVLLLALGPGAPADAGERADFDLRFAAQSPASPTKWTLHLRYKAPGDPDAKPYAIRRLSLRPPPGTRINVGTHTPCDAADAEIRLLGDRACPAASRIGDGGLTAMTGFGPPLDPYPTHLSLFSTRDGLVEVVKDARVSAVLAIERLTVRDGALTATPVVVPGGPPDGKIAARDIDWTVSSHGWLTTPAVCPRSGQWTSTGTFTFDDGATVTERSTTPCNRPRARRKASRANRRCRSSGRRSQRRRPGARPACRRHRAAAAGLTV
jgi:hypothetical protein